MSVRWFWWFLALTVFVLNCFWIINQAYSYRKNVSELENIKKVLHKTEDVNKLLKVHSDYQQSLYNIEKTVQGQNLFSPQKVKVVELPTHNKPNEPAP